MVFPLVPSVTSQRAHSHHSTLSSRKKKRIVSNVSFGQSMIKRASSCAGKLQLEHQMKLQQWAGIRRHPTGSERVEVNKSWWEEGQGRSREKVNLQLVHT